MIWKSPILKAIDAFHTIREGGRSGGMTIYCAMNLSDELIAELTISNETIESCVLECRTATNVIVVFAIHRAHTVPIEQLFLIICYTRRS